MRRLQVDEFLVRALRELARQRVARDAQRRRRVPAGASGACSSSCGLRPDRFDRRRHRQRLAVAVGDHAARGRDRDLAQEARVALLLVEVVVEQLQVERARDQRQRAQPSAPTTSSRRPRRLNARAQPRGCALRSPRSRRPRLLACAGRSWPHHHGLGALPGTSCRGGRARPGRCGCSRPRSPAPAAGGRTRC